MTEGQFKQLMEKLDKIEQEIKAGQWQHLFKPPVQPQPPYYPAWPPPHLVPSGPWGIPQVTD